MSAIRAAGPTGLRTSIAGTQTSRTEATDFGSLLSDKARATKGLNPTQMSACNKKALAAVNDAKPLLQSESDRLAVAAVIPGALGVLPPSGADMANARPQELQMADLDLQRAMQKQQQTMQTMSNISKSAHDTLKSIINNLRA